MSKKKFLIAVMMSFMGLSAQADESMYCLLQHHKNDRPMIKHFENYLVIEVEDRKINFGFDHFVVYGDESEEQKLLEIHDTDKTITRIVMTRDGHFLYANFMDEYDREPQIYCPFKPTSGGGN